jgi:hypothetical protein
MEQQRCDVCRAAIASETHKIHLTRINQIMSIYRIPKEDASKIVAQRYLQRYTVLETLNKINVSKRIS